MSMKFAYAAAVVVSLALYSSVHAQSISWGTGMWGAQQGCPYDSWAADGSSSFVDEIRDAEIAMKEARSKLREKKSRQKKVEKDLGRARTTVEQSIHSDYADKLFEHIDNRRTCDEYAVTSSMCSQDICLSPYKREDWNDICNSIRVGSVNASVACGLLVSRNPDRVWTDKADCSNAVIRYSKLSIEQQKIQREIDQLDRMIEDAKEEISTTKANAAEDARELRRSKMEGDFCSDCVASSQNRSSSDWAGVASNVGAGLLNIYLGYQMNKTAARNNAALGWPTQPYPALGYGTPFLANGIYGALGGGIGAGAFGCANGAGAGGIMSGVGNDAYGIAGPPMGGGMYLPGMGPWGAAGPGIGGGLSGMDGGLGSSQAQFQHQMMQIQMQQYQQDMQMRQREQQNLMQRQLAATRLQMEIYSLMFSLQQLQVPSSHNGGVSLGVGGGSFGIGAGLPPTGGALITPVQGPGGR